MTTLRAGPRLVLISRFCQLTGYTEEAVRKKIERRQWRTGEVIRKAPDGHIMIDLDEYERWAEGDLVQV